MSLERSLARLLEIGTWIASALVAIGLFFRPSVMTAGIALFISLPILRIVVMLGTYVTRRDRWGIAVATVVLSIVALGIALGATG